MESKLKNKKILITAGPTREYLDPVRYITNESSGKMGYAIAETLHELGADVYLISGPVNLTTTLPKEKITYGGFKL
jgi:phosphopantothenoylcysteine decarboxylase/phosphopantothenate--cysteine ligase